MLPAQTSSIVSHRDGSSIICLRSCFSGKRTRNDASIVVSNTFLAITICLAYFPNRHSLRNLSLTAIPRRSTLFFEHPNTQAWALRSLQNENSTKIERAGLAANAASTVAPKPPWRSRDGCCIGPHQGSALELSGCRAHANQQADASYPTPKSKNHWCV